MEKQETQIAEIFDKFIQSLSVLNSDIKLSADTKHNALINLMDDMQAIKERFLRDWHTVEAQDRIITEYQDYFETFGFNIQSVNDKIEMNTEIQHHLIQAKKYKEQIENEI